MLHLMIRQYGAMCMFYWRFGFSAFTPFSLLLPKISFAIEAVPAQSIFSCLHFPASRAA